jgi:hypothetical protein
VEKLQLGLWSGKVELSDLSLKPEALRELQLPVVVQSGIVRKISLYVPWNALGSESVVLSIEGVEFQVGKREHWDWTAYAEEKKKSALNLKRALLDTLEIRRQQQDSMAEVEAEVGQSYVNKMMALILWNLRIQISNIHCSFVEPGLLSAGITLDSLKLETTDANSKPGFENTPGARVFKSVHVQGFGTYCDVLTGEGSHASPNSASSTDRKRQYIQEPTSGHLFLAKDTSAQARLEGRPPLQATFRVDNVVVRMGSSQFRSACELTELFGQLQREERRYRTNKHRVDLRLEDVDGTSGGGGGGGSIAEAATATAAAALKLGDSSGSGGIGSDPSLAARRWQFAYRCVRDDLGQRNNWRSFHRFVVDRRVYIALWRRHQRENQQYEELKSTLDPLTAAEADELKRIEETMTNASVIVCRTTAAAKLEAERKKVEEEKAKQQGGNAVHGKVRKGVKGRGMMGFFFGGKKSGKKEGAEEGGGGSSGGGGGGGDDKGDEGGGDGDGDDVGGLQGLSEQERAALDQAVASTELLALSGGGGTVFGSGGGSVGGAEEVSASLPLWTVRVELSSYVATLVGERSGEHGGAALPLATLRLAGQYSEAKYADRHERTAVLTAFTVEDDLGRSRNSTMPQVVAPQIIPLQSEGRDQEALLRLRFVSFHHEDHKELGEGGDVPAGVKAATVTTLATTATTTVPTGTEAVAYRTDYELEVTMEPFDFVWAPALARSLMQEFRPGSQPTMSSTEHPTNGPDASAAVAAKSTSDTSTVDSIYSHTVEQGKKMSAKQLRRVTAAFAARHAANGGARAKVAAAAAAAARVHRFWKVRLDLKAPSIIIVEDASRLDTARLQLDLGRLQLNSIPPKATAQTSISAEGGGGSEYDEWEVELAGVQVITRAKGEQDTNLLDRFSIQLNVRSSSDPTADDENLGTGADGGTCDAGDAGAQAGDAGLVVTGRLPLLSLRVDEHTLGALATVKTALAVNPADQRHRPRTMSQAQAPALRRQTSGKDTGPSDSNRLVTVSKRPLASFSFALEQYQMHFGDRGGALARMEVVQLAACVVQYNHQTTIGLTMGSLRVLDLTASPGAANGALISCESKGAANTDAEPAESKLPVATADDSGDALVTFKLMIPSASADPDNDTTAKGDTGATDTAARVVEADFRMRGLFLEWNPNTITHLRQLLMILSSSPAANPAANMPAVTPVASATALSTPTTAPQKVGGFRLTATMKALGIYFNKEGEGQSDARRLVLLRMDNALLDVRKGCRASGDEGGGGGDGSGVGGGSKAPAPHEMVVTASIKDFRCTDVSREPISAAGAAASAAEATREPLLYPQLFSVCQGQQLMRICYRTGGGVAATATATEATATPSSQLQGPLEVGQTVQARWKSGDVYTEAKVLAANANGSYHLSYEDGHEWLCVPATYINPIIAESDGDAVAEVPLSTAEVYIGAARFVYVQAQMMELVDYLNVGVMGSLSDAQATAKEAGGAAPTEKNAGTGGGGAVGGAGGAGARVAGGGGAAAGAAGAGARVAAGGGAPLPSPPASPSAAASALLKLTISVHWQSAVIVVPEHSSSRQQLRISCDGVDVTHRLGEGLRPREGLLPAANGAIDRGYKGCTSMVLQGLSLSCGVEGVEGMRAEVAPAVQERYGFENFQGSFVIEGVRLKLDALDRGGDHVPTADTTRPRMAVYFEIDGGEEAGGATEAAGAEVYLSRAQYQLTMDVVAGNLAAPAPAAPTPSVVASRSHATATTAASFNDDDDDDFFDAEEIGFFERTQKKYQTAGAHPLTMNFHATMASGTLYVLFDEEGGGEKQRMNRQANQRMSQEQLRGRTYVKASIMQLGLQYSKQLESVSVVNLTIGRFGLLDHEPSANFLDANFGDADFDGTTQRLLGYSKEAEDAEAWWLDPTKIGPTQNTEPQLSINMRSTLEESSTAIALERTTLQLLPTPLVRLATFSLRPSKPAAFASATSTSASKARARQVLQTKRKRSCTTVTFTGLSIVASTDMMVSDPAQELQSGSRASVSRAMTTSFAKQESLERQRSGGDDSTLSDGDTDLFGMASSVLGGVGEGVGTVLGGVGEGVGSVLGGVGEGVGSVLGGVGEGVGAGVGVVGGAVGGAVGAGVDGVFGVFNYGASAVFGTTPTPASASATAATVASVAAAVAAMEVTQTAHLNVITMEHGYYKHASDMEVKGNLKVKGSVYKNTGLLKVDGDLWVRGEVYKNANLQVTGTIFCKSFYGNLLPGFCAGGVVCAGEYYGNDKEGFQLVDDPDAADVRGGDSFREIAAVSEQQAWLERVSECHSGSNLSVDADGSSDSESNEGIYAPLYQGDLDGQQEQKEQRQEQERRQQYQQQQRQESVRSASLRFDSDLSSLSGSRLDSRLSEGGALDPLAAKSTGLQLHLPRAEIVYEVPAMDSTDKPAGAEAGMEDQGRDADGSITHTEHKVAQLRLSGENTFLQLCTAGSSNRGDALHERALHNPFHWNLSIGLDSETINRRYRGSTNTSDSSTNTIVSSTNTSVSTSTTDIMLDAGQIDFCFCPGDLQALQILATSVTKASAEYQHNAALLTASKGRSGSIGTRMAAAAKAAVGGSSLLNSSSSSTSSSSTSSSSTSTSSSMKFAARCPRLSVGYSCDRRDKQRTAPHKSRSPGSLHMVEESRRSNAGLFRKKTAISRNKRIICGWYGHRGNKARGAEVTTQLRGLLRRGRLDFQVENEIFGDPAPGSSKHLVVEYEREGENGTHTLTVNEHQVLRMERVAVNEQGKYTLALLQGQGAAEEAQESRWGGVRVVLTDSELEVGRWTGDQEKSGMVKCEVSCEVCARVEEAPEEETEQPFENPFGSSSSGGGGANDGDEKKQHIRTRYSIDDFVPTTKKAAVALDVTSRFADAPETVSAPTMVFIEDPNGEAAGGVQHVGIWGYWCEGKVVASREVMVLRGKKVEHEQVFDIQLVDDVQLSPTKGQAATRKGITKDMIRLPDPGSLDGGEGSSARDGGGNPGGHDGGGGGGGGGRRRRNNYTDEATVEPSPPTSAQWELPAGKSFLEPLRLVLGSTTGAKLGPECANGPANHSIISARFRGKTEVGVSAALVDVVGRVKHAINADATEAVAIAKILLPDPTIDAAKQAQDERWRAAEVEVDVSQLVTDISVIVLPAGQSRPAAHQIPAGHTLLPQDVNMRVLDASSSVFITFQRGKGTKPSAPWVDTVRSGSGAGADDEDDDDEPEVDDYTTVKRPIADIIAIRYAAPSRAVVQQGDANSAFSEMQFVPLIPKPPRGWEIIPTDLNTGTGTADAPRLYLCYRRVPEGWLTRLKRRRLAEEEAAAAAACKREGKVAGKEAEGEGGEGVLGLSVLQMKNLLTNKGVDMQGVTEKPELQALVAAYATDEEVAAAAADLYNSCEELGANAKASTVTLYPQLQRQVQQFMDITAVDDPCEAAWYIQRAYHRGRAKAEGDATRGEQSHTWSAVDEFFEEGCSIGPQMSAVSEIKLEAFEAAVRSALSPSSDAELPGSPPLARTASDSTWPASAPGFKRVQLNLNLGNNCADPQLATARVRAPSVQNYVILSRRHELVLPMARLVRQVSASQATAAAAAAAFQAAAVRPRSQSVQTLLREDAQRLFQRLSIELILPGVSLKSLGAPTTQCELWAQSVVFNAKELNTGALGTQVGASGAAGGGAGGGAGGAGGAASSGITADKANDASGGGSSGGDAAAAATAAADAGGGADTSTVALLRDVLQGASVTIAGSAGAKYLDRYTGVWVPFVSEAMLRLETSSSAATAPAESKPDPEPDPASAGNGSNGRGTGPRARLRSIRRRSTFAAEAVPFQVLRAAYGSSEGMVDATSKLNDIAMHCAADGRKLQMGGFCVLSVEGGAGAYNKLFGCPCTGTKELHMQYELGGIMSQVTFIEDAPVSICSEDSQKANYAGIEDDDDDGDDDSVSTEGTGVVGVVVRARALPVSPVEVRVDSMALEALVELMDAIGGGAVPAKLHTGGDRRRKRSRKRSRKSKLARLRGKSQNRSGRESEGGRSGEAQGGAISWYDDPKGAASLWGTGPSVTLSVDLPQLLVALYAPGSRVKGLPLHDVFTASKWEAYPNGPLALLRVSHFRCAVHHYGADAQCGDGLLSSQKSGGSGGSASGSAANDNDDEPNPFLPHAAVSMRQELSVSVGSIHLQDMLPGLWRGSGGGGGSALVLSTPRQAHGGFGGLGKAGCWRDQLAWPSPCEVNATRLGKRNSRSRGTAGGDDEYAEPLGAQPDIKLWLVRIADYSVEYHFSRAVLRMNWPLHVQLAWPLMLRAQHWTNGILCSSKRQEKVLRLQRRERRNRQVWEHQQRETNRTRLEGVRRQRSRTRARTAALERKASRRKSSALFLANALTLTNSLGGLQEEQEQKQEEDEEDVGLDDDDDDGMSAPGLEVHRVDFVVHIAWYGLKQGTTSSGQPAKKLVMAELNQIAASTHRLPRPAELGGGSGGVCVMHLAGRKGCYDAIFGDPCAAEGGDGSIGVDDGAGGARPPPTEKMKKVLHIEYELNGVKKEVDYTEDQTVLICAPPLLRTVLLATDASASPGRKGSQCRPPLRFIRVSAGKLLSYDEYHRATTTGEFEMMDEQGRPASQSQRHSYADDEADAGNFSNLGGGSAETDKEMAAAGGSGDGEGSALVLFDSFLIENLRCQIWFNELTARDNKVQHDSAEEMELHSFQSKQMREADEYGDEAVDFVKKYGLKSLKSIVLADEAMDCPAFEVRRSGNAYWSHFLPVRPSHCFIFSTSHYQVRSRYEGHSFGLVASIVSTVQERYLQLLLSHAATKGGQLVEKLFSLDMKLNWRALAGRKSGSNKVHVGDIVGIAGNVLNKGRCSPRLTLCSPYHPRFLNSHLLLPFVHTSRPLETPPFVPLVSTSSCPRHNMLTQVCPVWAMVWRWASVCSVKGWTTWASDWPVMDCGEWVW